MKEINNSICEDYCSFEVSKLLKEKGFDVGLSTWYNNDGNEGFYGMKEKFYVYCSRPTHSLAIKWVRENFGFYIYSVPNASFNKWKFRIMTKFPIDKWYGSDDVGEYSFYDSEFDSLEAALLYTLKNLI